MAHDLFISYSAHDKPIADAVCAALEAERIRCWIAPRDVLPGVHYGEAIIDAINESHVLVLLFSSNSNHSPQVMREVERAVSKGIPILPFRIEDVALCKEMEYYISTPHWLDALTEPLEEHLGRLVQTAKRLLDREPHDEAPGSSHQEPHVATASPPSAFAAHIPTAAPGYDLAGLIGSEPPPELAGVSAPSDGGRRPEAGASGEHGQPFRQGAPGGSAFHSAPTWSGTDPRQPAIADLHTAAAGPTMSTGSAFARRFAAGLIDGLIVTGLWIVGLGTLAAALGGQTTNPGANPLDAHPVLGWSVAVAMSIAYCGGMLALRGQTLGKMALGLRVVGPDGGNPSFWRAAIRESVGKLVSGWALGLGYFWMLWDGRQQTWHDKIVQTHVELS